MPRGRSAIILGLFVGVVVAVLVVGVLLRPAGSAGSSGGNGAAKLGRPAPDFALRTTGGGVLSLSHFRGRPVLLNFFATWCIPCRSEMPLIERKQRANSGRLVVLGIDKQEPPSDVASFGRERGLTFPLLVDSSLAVWHAYGITIQPVSVWVDRAGVVRAIHYGPMDSRYIDRQLRRLA